MYRKNEMGMKGDFGMSPDVITMFFQALPRG